MAEKCDHEKLMSAGVHELKRVSDGLEKLSKDTEALSVQFQAHKKGVENDREQLDKRITRLCRDFDKESKTTKENEKSVFEQTKTLLDTISAMNQELKGLLQEKIAAIETSISLSIDTKFQELEARMDAIIERKINERLNQGIHSEHDAI